MLANTLKTGRLYLSYEVASIWGDDVIEAISHPSLHCCTVATDLGRWVEFTRYLIDGEVKYSALDKGPILAATIVR